MSLISTKERNKLFLKVKHTLGYPINKFELTDDMMDTYLEIAIEDYSSIVNEWLIHQKWVNLEGLDTNNSDFLSAFTTKSNDYMKSFTFAYSKQVGLGTNAPAAQGWELKQDFIETVADSQYYVIPAGREINEVLWETPPSINTGGNMIDPFGLSAAAPGGMLGFGLHGRGSMYVQPVYNMLLGAQDRRMKQKVLQSQLTYRITGLESGEKLLHLYPPPGSRYEISGRWGKHYAGRRVYYWYYETKNEAERDRCLEENSDIVRLPSDPPIDVLRWEKMNSVAQQQVRDLFISNVKMAIGSIRGMFSGDLSLGEKQLQMDYRHLLDSGKELKTDTIKKITEQLDKLTQSNLVKERAEIAENINKERSYQPFRTPIVPI
jgi:hypothetical protein